MVRHVHGLDDCKQAVQLLKESEHWLRLIMQNVRDFGIFTMDVSGLINRLGEPVLDSAYQGPVTFLPLSNGMDEDSLLFISEIEKTANGSREFSLVPA